MIDVTDEEAIKRFKREIKIIEKISHPNVVKILSSGEDEDGPYYCMPQYSTNLRSYLNRDLFENPEQQYQIFSEILGGVEVLHREGIIHRDLKPENILLNDPLDVVICDFGFSKDKNASFSYTSTGEGFGTPGYISPEQIVDAKHVDQRTDIYALGMILNDITGRNHGFPVPVAIKNVCGRAAAYDKNIRYSNITEMREAVKEAYRLWNRDVSSISIKSMIQLIADNKVSEIELLQDCDYIINSRDYIQGSAFDLGTAMDEKKYLYFERQDQDTCLRMHELIWQDWHDTWNNDYNLVDEMARTTDGFFGISESPEIKGFIVAELCEMAYAKNRFYAMERAADMIATMGQDVATRKMFLGRCHAYNVKANYKKIGKEPPSWL